MARDLYLTPADFEREDKAIGVIDRVVNEGMTVKAAVKEVGIGRSTWYRWVANGRVVHALRARRKGGWAEYPWTVGRE